MSRPSGARNKAFDAKRLELAERLRARLAAGGKRPSYAELAEAAGVSLATLRHYFGGRDAAVAAVMALHAPEGASHLDVLRRPSGAFAASMRDAAAFVMTGLRQPIVAELHAVGLLEGMTDSCAGPAYLTDILEPMILALEERLAAHIARGEMRSADTRVAALALIAPLFIAHLHQEKLGGKATRPLDRDDHCAAHVEAFVRGYAPA